MSIASTKKRARGFTLIELLVVIAIIGVLASIVLASLNNARRKSRDARRITDVKQIQLALELYFDSQGNQYPASSASCDQTTNARGLEALQTGGFIPQVPRDPLSSAGTPICYLYGDPGSPRTSYHLSAQLEDASNPAFSGDKDCNSGVAASCYTGSPIFNNNFDGTNDGTSRRYDVIP